MRLRGVDWVRWLLFGRGHPLKSAVIAAAWFPIPLRALAYRLPWRVRMMPRTHVAGRKLTVGDRTYISSGCFLEAIGPLHIGAGVHLASGVQLLTTTHEIGPASRRGGERKILATRVGDGCWLGANVVVLPGVTICDGCIVAAGAVVTSNCAPNGLYAGVPAARKRELP